MNLFGAACALIAAAIWGSQYVVAKYVLEYVPPLTPVVYRFAVALVVLAALLFATRGKRVPRRDLPQMALIGLVGYGISILAQFAGTKAVFFFAQPIVGAFLGWLLLGEHLGPQFFVGGFLIFAGVAVVSLARPAAIPSAQVSNTH